MAQSRVIFDNASNLTTGQQNQLNTDRQIRATRESNEAASKLAQIGLQNKGSMDVTTANNAGQLERENVSQAGQLERENISQTGQTGRQKMANTALIDSTKIKEQAETGRNTLTNTSAMDRLVAGNVHATETARLANDNLVAADHRKTGGAALLAGADPKQLGNVLNAHPGMPVDYSGVKVPLQNNRQGNYKFIAQPADPTTRTPAAIFVGNEQTGQVATAGGGAAAALAGGQQQPASPTGGVESGAEAGQGPQGIAGNAYSKVYQDNPQRLKEDMDFTLSQMGTVYKTPEEQKAYIKSLAQTNPTLYQQLQLAHGNTAAAQ